MTYHELWRMLTSVYEAGEAQAVARMVYEVRFGLSLSDICIGKDSQLSADGQTQLEEIAQRLLNQEPVQYVLGETTFAGRTFKVTPDVLIPRPETAELCNWLINTSSSLSGKRVLDIGTGSGCIAVTLALAWPEADVTGWDISAEALAVAQENAKNLGARVSFKQVDILKEVLSSLPWEGAGETSCHLIVSNPPYISAHEAAVMEHNVLDWEPHRALFVPDNDPLLFYNAIARYAQQALVPQGWLYFEINPLYADELNHLLSTMGYHNIEIKTDQYGKQRMIRAQR